MVRMYLDGPSLGPLRTVLWSSRSRPRVYVRKAPWWPRRFTTIRYWLLGIWALELEFWALYGLGWAAVQGWHYYKGRAK